MGPAMRRHHINGHQSRSEPRGLKADAPNTPSAVSPEGTVVPDFRAALLEQSVALKAIDSRRPSLAGWSDERETFQRLEAAVLYQAGSVAHFGIRLHEK
jgi:hypothetical protein